MYEVFSCLLLSVSFKINGQNAPGPTDVEKEEFKKTLGNKKARSFLENGNVKDKVRETKTNTFYLQTGWKMKPCVI